MNRDITLKQPEEGDQVMQTDRKNRLDGMYVFGSNHCPEHKTAVILAVPDPKSVDAFCLLEAIDDFKMLIIKQLIEHGAVRAIPVNFPMAAPPQPPKSQGEQM